VQTKSSGGWNEERTSSGAGGGQWCDHAGVQGEGVRAQAQRRGGAVEEWGEDRAGFACISGIANVKISYLGLKIEFTYNPVYPYNGRRL
jgi:hypothetical protein